MRKGLTWCGCRIISSTVLTALLLLPYRTAAGQGWTRDSVLREIDGKWYRATRIPGTTADSSAVEFSFVCMYGIGIYPSLLTQIRWTTASPPGFTRYPNVITSIKIDDRSVERMDWVGSDSDRRIMRDYFSMQGKPAFPVSPKRLLVEVAGITYRFDLDGYDRELSWMRETCSKPKR